MISRLLVASLLLFFFNNFSLAQEKQTQYIYEVSSDPWHGKTSEDFSWKNFASKQVTVSLNAVNYQVYNFGDFTSIFDAISFVFADNTKGSSFEPKIKTDKTSSETPTWKSSFEAPATSTMRCSSNLTADLSYKNTLVEKFEVVVNGEKKDVNVTKVVGSGYVSACGYNASMTQITYYSKEHNVLVSQEWVSFYNGAIRSGRKILLKEISTPK